MVIRVPAAFDKLSKGSPGLFLKKNRLANGGGLSGTLKR